MVERDDIEVWTAKLAIQELINRYTQVLLRCDWDGFEALFTDDATWTAPPPLDLEFVGARVIRDQVANLTADARFFLQVPLSTVVESVGDDRAKATTTVQEMVHVGKDEAILIYGVCYDEFANTAAGWRFTRRHFEPLYLGNTPMGGAIPADRTTLP